MLQVLFILLGLFSLTCASELLQDLFQPPTQRIPRDTFVKTARSSVDTKHELVFAVTQNNLPQLENILLERSTPGRASYQKWLSFDEVTALVSNAEGTLQVEEWLRHNDIPVTWKSLRGEYIKASAPIATWESLLQAQFHKFADVTSASDDTFIDRADEYSIPTILRGHINAIFNTVQTPPEINARLYRADKGASTPVSLRGATKHVTSGSDVTVSFLNSLYHIASNAGDATHKQSVFETNDQRFSPNDLDLFQTYYGLPNQAALDPSNLATTDCVNNDCFEGNLDVQYMMGIAQDTQTVYWYEGGSDPFVDYVTAVADDADPPLVNSISWGAVEQAVSPDTMLAFNTEALKLAAMGVTVVVSTGDDGVAGKAERCDTGSSSAIAAWVGTPWTGKGYFPSFPATSPYVTAVGATMGPENGDPEIACQSQLGGVITTGGGFSTFYATPSWQTDAVNAYFDALDGSNTPTSGFNRNGRAYPDVSLIGVNYQVVIQGALYNLYGTSASAPVFGAMISLINAVRVASNLTSVGFLNPTLYAYGANSSTNLFTDVTSGHNRCCASGNPSAAVCCDSGFHSIAGWDPVTGWGSAAFPELAQMLAAEVNYTLPATDDSTDSKKSSVLSLVAIILIIVGAFVVVTCLVSCLVGIICYPCQSRS